MSKKNYIFPFIALLVLSIVIFGLGMFVFSQFRETSSGYVRVFSWTLILLAESVVYWFLRKINIFRRASSVHVILFLWSS
jgi:hypothetical protein